MSDRDCSFLEVHRVSKSFGNVPALRDVSFCVEEGEFVSVIGPSGSGKSTLLKILAGVESQSDGSIRIRGEALTGDHEERSSIVMVWQSLALFPHMSVAGNVGFGLAVRDVAKTERAKRVEDILEKLGLSGYETRSIHELSGGEQQRVALARALVLEPTLLLLDEPFGALDAHLRRHLQGELRSLHRTFGLTILMVTHDQNEAFALSQRVAILRDGGIEQIDVPSAIRERPATGFVARFVGIQNVFNGEVQQVSNDSVCVSTLVGEFRARPTEWLENDLKRGMCAAYVIQPHKVRIGTDAQNCVKGVVESHKCDGFVESINVSVNDLGSIQCQTRRDKTLRVQVDDEISLSWDSMDSFVVPETLHEA